MTLTGCQKQLDKKLAVEVINFCRHISGAGKMTAACLCYDFASGDSDSKSILEVLAVVDDFTPRLMNYFKVFGDRNVLVTAVGTWVLERDVDRGFLGEALAGRLIFPYSPLINAQYFKQLETKLKKRLIYELLENLVLDYPEISYQVYIKPEYFMYEAMISRARVFPLLNYSLLEFSREDRRTANVELVLPAYIAGLRELEKDQVVRFSGEYVTVCSAFVEKVKSRNARFINLFKSGQRTLFASLLSVFPQLLSTVSQNAEFLSRFQRVEDPKSVPKLRPSEQYLFVPTHNGMVPLSNSVGIEDFARKMFRTDVKTDVKVEDLGGILNDVFLVTVSTNSEEKRIVAKRFRDWSSFKWFPLTLWSVGTRSFVVLGRSRLEREYAINQVLRSKGFAVPKVLYVSGSERLIFKEYVEGEDLSETIREAAVTKTEYVLKSDLEIVTRAGELLAKVHAAGVALGDTKPENFMLNADGEILLLDLEQASRKGDKVWDVAEFIYYAGHYVPMLVEARRAELIAKAFIKGYTKCCGDVRIVKRAGNPKYTKVFSVFTFPHIMLAFSALCRKADKPEAD